MTKSKTEGEIKPTQAPIEFMEKWAKEEECFRKAVVYDEQNLCRKSKSQTP
jgi:hypothetical protein